MKIAKVLLITIFVIIILFIFFLTSIFLQTGTNQEKTEIKIPQGATGSSVAGILKEKGVIKREIDFKIAAKLVFIDNRIKSGIYVFPPYPFLIETLVKLKQGKAATELPLKVTFPEGSSIYKMGTILEEKGIPSFAAFRDLEEREGYLFPDTYIFNRDISAEALADIMQKRFDEVVMTFWENNRSATKLSLYQILTLASIIEKESRHDDERKIISSVFYNRLKINMPLAADPTVKYSLENPSKRVLYSQLKVDSPYNTYKYRGLPPGPICNPGIKSIEAAIYPADTKYLFFVAKSDGSHIFSTSWEGHQKARITAQHK